MALALGLLERIDVLGVGYKELTLERGGPFAGGSTDFQRNSRDVF